MTTIEELRNMIMELWNIRGYKGFNEFEMNQKVQRLIPNEIIGIRPLDKDGFPLVPEIIGNRTSYTKAYENQFK